MKAYKLTDGKNFTKNGTEWGENVSHTAAGDGKELCTDGFIHFYTNPFISTLMNSAHANFKNPKLWECETAGEEIHEVLKSGCKTLTTLREIPLPEISLTQKVVFAILCAKKVYVGLDWNIWADKWLSGEDRTEESAIATYNGVTSHTWWGCSSAASHAAQAAILYAVSSHPVSSYAYASRAAHHAAHVASRAAEADRTIDFIEIVNEAMKY